MAWIILLNGVSFKVKCDDPYDGQERLEADEEFMTFDLAMKGIGLQLDIVPNTEDSNFAVILGRNIIPKSQTIYQGGTICGDHLAQPLPDNFAQLQDQLQALVTKHFEAINFTDVGIILSQFD